MTHMARIRYIFQSAIHFQKKKPKTKTQTQPTLVKLPVWSLKGIIDLGRKKLMLSCQETCRAAQVTTCGIMYDLTFKLKIFAKNLKPFSVLLATRKVSFF